MNLDDPAQFLEAAAISRPNHTPEIRCLLLLDDIEQHAVAVFGGEGREIFHNLAQSLYDGGFKGVGGDEFIAGLMRDGDELFARGIAFTLPEDFFYLTAGMAYAIKAIHTWREGREREAWDFAFDAAQHSGLLSGRLSALRAMQPLPSREDWKLIEPMRGDILSRVMYETLKADKDKGHPRPAFTQFFNRWLAAKPTQFLNIMPSEVTILDEDGEARTFFTEAVKDRYKRMTAQKKKSSTSKKGR